MTGRIMISVISIPMHDKYSPDLRIIPLFSINGRVPLSVEPIKPSVPIVKLHTCVTPTPSVPSVELVLLYCSTPQKVENGRSQSNCIKILYEL